MFALEITLKENNNICISSVIISTRSCKNVPHFESMLQNGKTNLISHFFFNMINDIVTDFKFTLQGDSKSLNFLEITIQIIDKSISFDIYYN